jgi:hypothetical protein
MQLIPSRNFTVVRQIGNHTDTATYYVRAVIRDAYSDVILDTLDLTDKGGQRFKKDWLVPQEPSGLGKFISIVTSVYTDSGYTTKSENYSDEENTYLWAVLNMNTGGGIGAMQSEKFNYRRIEEIVGKAIETIPSVEIPEPKDIPEPIMRWDEVLSMLSDVKVAIASIPTETKDDAEVLSKLEEISKLVNEKEVTPETDLKPILDKLNEDTDTNELNHDEARALISASEKKIIKAILPEVTKALKKIKIVTATATHFSVDGKNASSGKTKNEQDAENPTEEKAPTEEIDHIGIANSLTQ